ncbi:MAG: hypothetical protein HY521_01125 [Proteobacteria bacterium]|nr:hypothetical protein [Pseudomonadota bacterium]
MPLSTIIGGLSRGSAPPSDVSVSEMKRAIGLLERTHARLSLFILQCQDDLTPSRSARLEQALDHIGVTGRLGGRTFGLLYIGPRCPGRRGDAEIERRIMWQLRGALRRSGDERLASLLILDVVHFWSDQGATIPSLLAKLETAVPGWRSN